jgi:Lar family restriction alleviation protein
MHCIEQAQEALKPCPFCGGEAQVSTFETESLWSSEQVTYTKVSCDECDIAFQTEPSHEIQAAKAWNRRASPSTPVDGVGAEPRVESFQAALTIFDDAGKHRIERHKVVKYEDYLAALASPEAEARLRERVDVTKILADVEAGKHDVFVNKGDDPHGNGPDLDCPYCGGSGHKGDVEGPRACGFEYNGEGYSATGAEARLAQAEGGPAVTHDMVARAQKAADDALWNWRGLGKRKDGEGLDGMYFFVRAALEAALHPQSAAGEEGK